MAMVIAPSPLDIELITCYFDSYFIKCAKIVWRNQKSNGKGYSR